VSVSSEFSQRLANWTARRTGPRKRASPCDSQCAKDAVPFYARYGFIVTGDEFEDAGIAHRIMERTLEFTPQTM
jgi:predicted GNAT family N-acyltransferase